MSVPATITQVVIVLLLVLPGVMYQFVRERARGVTPGHRDLGERILRAVAAGIVLDTLYVAAGGSWLVSFIYDRQRGWLTGMADEPRLAALGALLLLVTFPAGVALLISRLSLRGSGAVRTPTPTAWDHAFHRRGHCFVRIRLKSGRWLAGWYGERAYASSYPEPADLYLQSAWAVSRSGWLERPLERSGGIYIRMDEVECIDFIDVPPASGSGTDG